jgi:hypothetical protein
MRPAVSTERDLRGPGGVGNISMGNVLVLIKDFDRIDLSGTVHIGEGFPLSAAQAAS